MMVEIENGCPLDIGFGVGDSWYTAKKVEWQVGLQEKLEWNVDLYDWDGDINKFSEWAVTQIHQFNAEDVTQMLDKVNFDENAQPQERVFPVNYGLELNKYMLVELGKGDNWRKSIPYIDFGDVSLETVSPSERSSLLYKSIGTLHINKRLRLFKDLTGYSREGVEDMFVDLSELDLSTSENTSERDAQVVKQEEEERALRLITEQVMDFGMKLESDAGFIMLNYSKELYRFIKTVIALETDCPDGYRIIFYSMKEDALKELTGYRLPEGAVSDVRQFLGRLGYFVV